MLIQCKEHLITVTVVNYFAYYIVQYVTSHLGQLSLGISSWVGTMNTSQRVVMPCSWGINVGVVRVWVAGKTVWSPCYTRAISEHFRDMA